MGPPNVQIRKYAWEEFETDARKIADTIKSWDKEFPHIYGLSRGGLTLAVRLSHLLLPDHKRKLLSFSRFSIITQLPESLEKFQDSILIVDDIADTGETLSLFKEHNFFIVTLFKHPQSIVTPDIWIREKDSRWIEFPWEAP